MSHVTCHMSHVTCQVQHIMCWMSPDTMSHIPNANSHSHRPYSWILPILQIENVCKSRNIKVLRNYYQTLSKTAKTSVIKYFVTNRHFLRDLHTFGNFFYMAHISTKSGGTYILLCLIMFFVHNSCHLEQKNHMICHAVNKMSVGQTNENEVFIL